MRILHRNMSLLWTPARIWGAFLTIARALTTFKRPFVVLRHYIATSAPRDGRVDLRDGTRIRLSGHVHDLVTVLVVTCRGEYGKIASGSVVVDIGANIGVFTIHAVRCGAARVYAFEPNAAAHACLWRNVEENGMTGRVRAFRLAVSARSCVKVGIAREPSPHNAICDDEAATSVELVETITLDDIVSENVLRRVDLLKLDCEGAEYSILRAASPATLSKIEAIRMEYHPGPTSALVDFLEASGFRVVKRVAQHAHSGILWMANCGGAHDASADRSSH